MRTISIKTSFNILTILLFCCLIFSSPLVMIFSENAKWSDSEKRSLALMPSLPNSLLGFSDYFTSINDHYQDHFGFRNFYIHRYERELEKRFNKTSIKSRVIKGLEDWYFFDKFGLIDDFFGNTPLSQKEIGTWLNQLNDRNQWLASYGIKYLYAITPNKQSIYPQYLMKNGLLLKGISHFEQMQEQLSSNQPDYFIDLHTTLKYKSTEEQLYFKHDTHWNRRGAYFAFQQIFKKISQWFPNEQFKTHFKFADNLVGIGGNTGQGGDLMHILKLKDKTETYPVLKSFKHGSNRINTDGYNLSKINLSSNRPSYGSICTAKNLRAIVFRDSFFVQLEPFFSENFKQVIYLWKSYDQKNIEEIMAYYKPDIVIEIIVERHAFDFFKKNFKQLPTHIIN